MIPKTLGVASLLIFQVGMRVLRFGAPFAFFQALISDPLDLLFTYIILELDEVFVLLASKTQHDD